MDTMGVLYFFNGIIKENPPRIHGTYRMSKGGIFQCIFNNSSGTMSSC